MFHPTPYLKFVNGKLYQKWMRTLDDGRAGLSEWRIVPTDDKA